MQIPEMLRNRTTWAYVAVILNAPLLAFGVSPKIVAGILIIVGGLAGIFQRAATQKVLDKNVTENVEPK